MVTTNSGNMIHSLSLRFLLSQLVFVCSASHSINVNLCITNLNSTSELHSATSPFSTAMASPHILLVTYPAQGHINPILQFAKRLVGIGVRVTLATSGHAIRRMNKTSTLQGLSFSAFSDGYENGFKPGDDIHHFMSEFRRVGSETLTALIVSSAKEGNKYTCIVYSILIPWVAKVAKAFQIPCTLFWNQTATMFDIYYYYFRGYGEIIRNNINDPSFTVTLPRLPELGSRDLPSFLVPSNSTQYTFAILPLFKEQFEVLDEETKPKVLVNTFDALEFEALKAVDKYNLVGIGPLIPSAFLDGKDPSDTSFGGDLFNGSNDYIEWLSTKPQSSVVYVSFGSLSVLSKPQMEELAKGLLDTGRPFLWVIRAKEVDLEDEDKLSCIEELEQQGKIVPWCSQVEVLSHPSVGCFVTHCGWNSTFEILCSGVPAVAFPQWTDQGTNAKLVVDVWKTGVRVDFNKQGIVERYEFKRCLELVMGGEERGKELRRSANKWKELAREAGKEGGSSDRNLKDYVEEIALCC